MIHKILAALFILFAVVQYNDADFFIWMPVYLVVGLVILLFDHGIYNMRVLQLLLLAYIIAMITYYPDVMSWIREGTPSITGSMKAESPFIEFIREFFGLLLCAITLGYYTRLVSKKQEA